MTNSNDSLQQVWQSEQQINADLRDSLSRPSTINYSELDNLSDVDFSEVVEASYAEVDKDKAIRRWCRDNGKDADNTEHYIAAMNALGYRY
jgi:hypothetical protein